MEQEINPKRKKLSIYDDTLEKQLLEWYQEKEASKKIISYKVLLEKAKEISNNVGGPADIYRWLNQYFIKRHKIQFNAIKVEIGLINWLLDQIRLKKNFSYEKFKEKALELMDENSPSMQKEKEEIDNWLSSFKECHVILINSLILSDISYVSDRTLDNKIFASLRKSKGFCTVFETLMYYMECKEYSGSSRETEKKDWLSRMKERYGVSNMPEILQNVMQTDNEANQSNV